jgi:hypothetical protein
LCWHRSASAVEAALSVVMVPCRIGRAAGAEAHADKTHAASDPAITHDIGEAGFLVEADVATVRMITGCCEI